MKMYALVDCNNFFVSCERVFNIDSQHKPTVVLSGNDGCIISRSQEVKDMGVPMGIPYFKMQKLFDTKHMKIFSSNFRLYRDMSERVMSVIKESAQNVQIYSIDEAFLEVSNEGNIEQFCTDLHEKIKQYTGIPVSIGIAPTKTLAKVANQKAKKTGLPIFAIQNNSERENLLQNTTVGQVWGIGRKMADKLEHANIRTAYEFTKLDNQWIQSRFGVVGLRLAYELRGKACFGTDENRDRRKSIISSRSFGKSTEDFTTILDALYYHVRSTSRQMRDEKSAAHYMSIALYTNRHKNVPQNNVREYAWFDAPLQDTFMLMKHAKKLLQGIYQPGFLYMKTGVTLGSFVPEEYVSRRNLFDEVSGDDGVLMETIDAIHDTHGNNSLSIGVTYNTKEWLPKRNFISPNYTTSWNDLLRVK